MINAKSSSSVFAGLPILIGKLKVPSGLIELANMSRHLVLGDQ